MAIEIKELIIRAIVTPQSREASKPSGKTSQPDSAPEEKLEYLVKMIKNKNER